MVLAMVVCRACGVLVKMGTERWRKNKAFCEKCFDAGREEEVAKQISNMAKLAGTTSGLQMPEKGKKVKPAKPAKVEKPKVKAPDKCLTCSGSEVKCKCGNMLCAPINKDECEQRRHGKLCLDCFNKAMGGKA